MLYLLAAAAEFNENELEFVFPKFHSIFSRRIIFSIFKFQIHFIRVGIIQMIYTIFNHLVKHNKEYHTELKHVFGKMKIAADIDGIGK